MKALLFTEADIHTHCTAKVYARGEEYYEDGMVLEVVRRGDLLHAEVEGSEEEPYLVSVGLAHDLPAEAGCTCPYMEEWDGWCKHIVATLLFCLHSPGDVETRRPLDKQLAKLSRDRLQSLVLTLAARHPRVVGDIEELAQGA